MAGCEFNPNNDLIHFNLLETQQLEMLRDSGVKNAAEQARKNALIIFNTISFPQNVRSLVRDEIPRKDQIPAAWEIRDGQVCAEGFGSPEEVWENTRIHNPDQFNQKEKDAALLGFKLLLTGEANTVAYPMNDKNGIRYIPVLRRIGNTIINESIDVGKVNRDLTPVEGGDVLRLFQEQHSNTSHLVIKDSDFPLLVLEEPPTVTQLQELALGRSLISDKNPFLATQSISKVPELLKQALPETNQRLAKPEDKVDQIVEKISTEKPEKSKMNKTKPPLFKKTWPNLVPSPEVVKERFTNFAIKIKEQISKTVRLLPQKVEEFAFKLKRLLPKKKHIEPNLKLKPEVVRVNFLSIVKDKAIMALTKIRRTTTITEKPKHISAPIGKGEIFVRAKVVKIAVKDTIMQVFREMVKPLEKIKLKIKYLIAKIIEKLSPTKKATLIQKIHKKTELIKKPLNKALKEVIRIKLVEPMRKIVKENKLISKIVDRAERLKIKFVKLRCKIFRRGNLPEKGLVKINKLAIRIKEKSLWIVKTREIINRSLKLAYKKIKQFWFYLNRFLFRRKSQAEVGQKNEVKKRPQKLKRQRLSFWLWLVKAISKHRENKIPALNFPKIILRKKILPKSGVIFVWLKEK